MHIVTMVTIPALALSLGACSESSDSTTTSNTPSAGGPDAVAAWLLTAEPENVMTILEAKASAKEGDTIAIRGRIGGRKQPMSDESNIFTFIDLALPYCGENGQHDTCTTPWDYCCDPPNVINAHGATVQILGTEGGMPSVLPTEAGLSPLDELIVIGTVAPRPGEQVLTIRATGVFRVEG